MDGRFDINMKTNKGFHREREGIHSAVKINTPRVKERDKAKVFIVFNPLSSLFVTCLLFVNKSLN